MHLFRGRRRRRGEGGFTLIELLVVVGIILILFGVIFVAVDPARRFAQARNANRREDIRDILEATLTYIVDNTGNYPSGLDNVTTSAQVLGTATTGCDTTCTATTTVSSCLDLSNSVGGTYIAKMPPDPKTGTDANTDYYVNKQSTGRITVGACDPELSVSMDVTR